MSTEDITGLGTGGAPEAPAARRAPPDNITVEQGGWRLAQKIHASAIIIVPTIGTIAAIWLWVKNGITWTDIWLCVGFYLFSMFGVTLGYHRLFSHRAFKSNAIVRFLLAVGAMMTAQGSVVYWVANHRRHHQYTDIPGDVHSPYIRDEGEMDIVTGFWHSHSGWTFGHKMTNALLFAKDIYRDPLLAWTNRMYLLWVFLGLLLPAIIGGLITQSWYGALTGFLWGGLVRMFLSYHFVNGIDSVTHIIGTQPFHSADHSVNNAVWAIPTLGEGWHNNHHAFPSSAIFGIEWYQYDPGAWLLRGLEKIGWVWDIQEATPAMVEAKRRKSQAA